MEHAIKTIGIMGGGQLGRMLAMAAAHLGFRAHIFTPEADSPAAQVSSLVTVAAYDDASALQAFAQSCDIITFEFENIPHESLALLAQHCRVAPSPEVLRICRNRLREKEAVRAEGIETAPCAAVDSLEALEAAIEQIGTPCVLKSCELGYDGKGQFKIESPEQAAEAWQALKTQEAVLEAWLAYDCEISVIVARSEKGDLACFEPAHNLHRNHILHTSTVPCGQSDAVIAQAQAIAKRLAEALQLIGIMAVELFVMPDGRLLVNELAPRPHNSGHWTIEAAATSQFEQHLRAILDLPLGATDTVESSVMVNLLGEEGFTGPARYLGMDKLLDMHGVYPHLYGKAVTKPGRKMGHITIVNSEIEKALEMAEVVKKTIKVQA